MQMCTALYAKRGGGGGGGKAPPSSKTPFSHFLVHTYILGRALTGEEKEKKFLCTRATNVGYCHGWNEIEWMVPSSKKGLYRSGISASRTGTKKEEE